MQLCSLRKWSLLAILFTALFGCTEDPTEAMVRQAAVIESGDECHLCGMIIINYPGPKGESFQASSDSAMKFCSTRDLFSFLLQPENTRHAKEIYVHDMSKTPWQKPEDQYFIDAREAWYVVGSSQTGAMGQTLASFGKMDDAKAFSKEFGGEVYPFEEITLDIL